MPRTLWLLLISVMFSPHAAQVTSTTAKSLDFEFYRSRVEPIFLKPREGLGPGGPCFVCHTKVTSRFRLQPVSPGATSWSEEESRRNYEVVKQLVAPGEPLKSRLLLHPLAAESGGDPVHAGGKFWQTRDDPEWQILAEWVRTGSEMTAVSSSPAPPPPLDFEVFKTRVQPIFLNKRAGLARCYVCHSQGTSFRLQPLSPGQATWNEEESRRNFEAVQRVVVPGEPQSSRMLMLPLAAEAGGETFHPGGKRWTARSDPEWQLLASWVLGQPPR